MYSDENRSVVVRKQGYNTEMNRKEGLQNSKRKTSEGNRYDYFLDFGNGFMDIQRCQILLNCILYAQLIVCK